MRICHLSIGVAGIAIILAFAGCFNQQQSQPAPQGTSDKYVVIQGPLFSIQTSPNVYDTVNVRRIFIELNPAMDQTRMVGLRTNLIRLKAEIKDACQKVVTEVGYQDLFKDEKRAVMEGRLRQEIIRLLKGNFTSQDVIGVILDNCSISS